MGKEEGKEKFSLTYCKSILNKNGHKYTDEQVLQMREFLFMIAELDFNCYQKEKAKRSTNASTK